MSRQTQDDRDEEIKIELLGEIRDYLKRLVEIAEHSPEPKSLFERLRRAVRRWEEVDK